MKAPVILTNKVWLPNEVVKLSEIKRKYEVRFYDEAACNRCEYKPDRHCEICDTCPAFQGNFKLWQHGEIDGHDYVGIPYGDRKTANALIEKTGRKVVDKRSRAKIKNKTLKFREKVLRDYQGPAVDVMEKKKRGVMKSPPRTGKTVMGTALTLRVGYKTLILAHQNDLLEQFLETFKDPKFTNFEDVDNGRTIKICKTYEDFKKHDVCLATYQMFLQKRGQKLLKKIRSMFGHVFIDEIHKGAANGYSKVIGQLAPYMLIGVSGTPQRKDGKHILVEKIVGKIILDTKASALKPKVRLIMTPAKSKAKWTGRLGWYKFNKFLERDKGRNELILENIMADLSLRPKRHIMIPIVYQSQADYLVKEINRRYGKKIAVAFTGKVVDRPNNKARTKLLDELRAGKYRVTVAQRRMLLGVNVPLWSLLYEIAPISNPPNFDQEIKRICTPMEGKAEPLIKFFIDDLGISRGCFRTCFKTFQAEQIQFTSDSKKLLSSYLSGGRQVYQDDDEYDKQFKVRNPDHDKRFGKSSRDYGTRKMGRRF